MKIIRKAAEVRTLEQRADSNGHSLASLMEKAGTRSAEWILSHCELSAGRVLILCGKGNNGGDGYVAARVLRIHNCSVDILQVDGAPATDLARNAAACAEAAGISYVSLEGIQPEAYCCVVDAVYGIGFRGGLRDTAAKVFTVVNRWRIPRIALDLPSGTVCDTCEADPCTFRATVTLSFMCLKPVHVHAPSDAFCGHVYDIGLDIPAELEADLPVYAKMLEGPDVAAKLPERSEESSKGTYGRALCLCGSYGMAGAAALAATGALKTGCGLVQMAIPESIYPILAANLWEPVYTPLTEQNGRLAVTNAEKMIAAAKHAKAMLIGCGMGVSPAAELLTERLVREAECPLILDADGINCICAHKMVMQERSGALVLTPHPGEMARLTGKNIQDIQQNRVVCARETAAMYRAVVVLKGHHTVIADPDGSVYICPTGNNGMAKGGSGDLLAGMMVSLLAQGMNPTAAACAAVYLHGLAGDLCREKMSCRAMQPSDMASCISDAFCTIEEEADIC